MYPSLIAGKFGILITGDALANMAGAILRLPYYHEECVHF